MKSYFFDAHVTGMEPDGSPIYDREYYAEDHASYYSSIFSNGVFMKESAAACLVAASGGSGGEPRKLTVSSGRAFINGYQCICEGDDVFVVSDLPNGHYRVFIRLDKNENVRGFSCELVYGSASEYPEPERSANIYDLCLADVVLTDGMPTVTDTRSDPALCGQVMYKIHPEEPPYYPPSDLPQMLWTYANFPETMDPGEISQVEGNPSLMAIWNASRVNKAALAEASQTEAQAGIISDQRSWSPQRVAQAVRGVPMTGFAAAGTPAATDNLIQLLNKMAYVATQAEAETGTATQIRGWTPQRVMQAGISATRKRLVATLTASGTFNIANYTRRDGTPLKVGDKIDLYMVSGGQSGGPGTKGSSQALQGLRGGVGGCGGYTKLVVDFQLKKTSYAYVIGAGGASVPQIDHNNVVYGNGGGSTSFGSEVVEGPQKTQHGGSGGGSRGQGTNGMSGYQQGPSNAGAGGTNGGNGGLDSLGGMSGGTGGGTENYWPTNPYNNVAYGGVGGGGGGGVHNGYTATSGMDGGAGGVGGGGNGGNGARTSGGAARSAGAAGAPNTGGGGGGGASAGGHATTVANGSASGAGGSGVILVYA